MSQGESTLRLAGVAVLAAFLVGTGVVFLVWPAAIFALAPPLESMVSTLDPAFVVLVLVVVFVLFAPTLGITGRLWAPSPDQIIPRSSARSTQDQPPAGTPEMMAERLPLDDWIARQQPPVGAAYDREIDLATAYDSQPRAIRKQSQKRTKDALREVAVSIYAHRTGHAVETARQAIERGTWTDDRRAAAFLAGDDGPKTPLLLWFVDLCTTADPFRRSLERTIDELEAVHSEPVVVE